jgi:FixJ family two-component response regulator
VRLLQKPFRSAELLDAIRSAQGAPPARARAAA